MKLMHQALTKRHLSFIRRMIEERKSLVVTYCA